LQKELRELEEPELLELDELLEKIPDSHSKVALSSQSAS
jgi:hypothetical protein